MVPILKKEFPRQEKFCAAEAKKRTHLFAAIGKLPSHLFDIFKFNLA
jgi:hypothetical protein